MYEKIKTQKIFIMEIGPNEFKCKNHLTVISSGNVILQFFDVRRPHTQ